jgi:hypothetical protein
VVVLTECELFGVLPLVRIVTIDISCHFIGGIDKNPEKIPQKKSDGYASVVDFGGELSLRRSGRDLS